MKKPRSQLEFKKGIRLFQELLKNRQKRRFAVFEGTGFCHWGYMVQLVARFGQNGKCHAIESK